MDSERPFLSIGDVLSLLKSDFPDITISKIRFLESQGLLDPERTPSGYRKFYEDDIERLRWILRQQRENFLPLKVIKGKLDQMQGADSSDSQGQLELGLNGGAQSDGATTAAPTDPSRSTPRGVAVAPVADSTADADRGAAPRAAPRAASEASPREDDGLRTRRSADPAARREEAALLAPERRTATSPQPMARSGAPAPSSATRSEAVAARVADRASGAAATPEVSQRPAPRPESPAPQGDPRSHTSPPSRPSPSAQVADSPARAVQRPPAPTSEPPRQGRGSLPSGGADDGLRTAREALGLTAPRPGGDARQARAALGLDGGGEDSEPPRASTDSGKSLNLRELSEEAQLPEDSIEELIRYGLIAGRPVAGTVYFDEDALAIARLASGFRRHGIDARHLRMYRLAAEREVGLFEQIIVPILKQRNPEARKHARQTLNELSKLGQQMRTAMVRSVVQALYRP